MTIWTDERVVLLKSMWADGSAAALISDKLDCGITRSAVLGKVHRLGLSARPTVTYRIREKKIVPARNPKPRKIEIRKRLPDGGLPPMPVAAPEVLTTNYLCSLFDLTNESCRWPCWSEDTPFEAQRYCGTPTASLVEGRPYCSHHDALAFNAPQPRKVAA